MTDAQKDATARAAEILNTQGYAAFLHFIAFNKQQHEQALQQAAIRKSFGR